MAKRSEGLVALSAGARKEAEMALAAFYEETDKELIPTIERLVETWSRFTARVETGWNLDFDSYRNGIDSRWVIGVVLNALHFDASAPLSEVVYGIDKRFYAATAESRRPIGSRPEWIGDFYRRIPKRLEGEARSLSELLD